MKKLMRREEADTREGGFTLVEMVMTVAVLAVIFLAVAGVLESGLRALAASKARARANEIATQGIEDLQRYSFNSLGFCSDPTTPAPAGLETPVKLGGPAGCTAGSFTEEYPCPDVQVSGTVPKPTYTCKQNNVTYTVKRYVAWVDALQTTKRLAVYVEWDDLVGRHQVSQQSSLRAPDQSAITGLAPPTFTSTPNLNPPSPVFSLDGTGRISSGSVLLQAHTSALVGPASTVLSAGSTIPTHQQDQIVDITVANPSGFPSYNGYPVTIEDETYTVIAGAGTFNWRLRATTAGEADSGSVQFYGDKVFVNVQTLAANGSPQTSTIFLTSPSANQWQVTLDASAQFTFGAGRQHVAFGILRAADGKSTGAFADSTLQFCQGSCDPSTWPTFAVSTTDPSGTIPIGTSGELLQDVVLEATTSNLTSVDVVTVSVLTQSGTVSIALERKENTTCLGPAEATLGNPCQWKGRIPRSSGLRFSSGVHKLYFAGQQVVDTVNPATIDKGSTAVSIVSVTFG